MPRIGEGVVGGGPQTAAERYPPATSDVTLNNRRKFHPLYLIEAPVVFTAVETVEPGLGRLRQ